MKKPFLRVVLVCVILSTHVLADWRDDVGFTRLQTIVGGDLPTDLSDGFTQVEGLESGANYMPNTLSSIYQGKNFVNKTNTSSVTSNHANTVATNFYSTSSLLPGTAVTTVDVYSADSWLNEGFLNTGTTNEPAVENRAVQNHSWIALDGDTAAFEEVSQRLDYAIDRDGFVSVVGENNGSSTILPKLLGQGYHTIAVGRTDGLHSYSSTTIDGTGRIKPDIVAPSTATSYATPMVASAAGVLYQKLQASPYLLAGADLPRVIKAMLMASARKDSLPGWDHTTSRPLDDIYGAGELNIHNAYMILTAGRAASGTTQYGQRGWAAESITSGTTKSYFFTVSAGAPSTPFCTALVWHRVITDNLVSPVNWGNLSTSMANLNLSLYHATGTTRGSLVIQSLSAVDNIEMIYQASLAPGDYEIVVSSDTATATPYALAWHSLPAVTVSVTTAEAKEIDGQDGVLTFTRTGDTTYPLYVPISITGDAVAGTHYTSLPSSLTIPAGQSSATLSIDPISDNTAQGDRSVIVTIASDFAIVSDSSSPGTITIKDKPADEWKFNAFTESELADSNISGDDADPDGDSIKNLLEYAFNLGPKVSNTSPVVLGETSGYLSLGVAKNSAATDLTWSAEVSPDLSEWQTAAIITNTQSAFEARDTVLKSSATKRFMRIKVTRP